MRNPARVDPEAIEEARRFLKNWMLSDSWKADRDPLASDARDAIREVEDSNLSEGAKYSAWLALREQMKKRHAKPTRNFRDLGIGWAAYKLVRRGYRPTRNDVTRHSVSASSIICDLLQGLGEPMTEKRVNAIVSRFMKSDELKYMKNVVLKKSDVLKYMNSDLLIKYSDVLKYLAD